MAGRHRRTFGYLRRLPSGRYQASYIGPDLARHTARSTFETKRDAEAWLAAAQTDISRDEWRRPVAEAPQVPLFGAYAQSWLDGRTLRPITRRGYQGMLDGYLVPRFGGTRLDDITPAVVRAWHAGLDAGKPTHRAHVYALLKVILGTAVDDEVLASNPCRVRGASVVKRARRIVPATPAELDTIVAAMPQEYGAAVLLAAWCALRFGEVAELRRGDVDVERGRVSVTRQVQQVDGAAQVSDPKTVAGVRVVAVPPHVLPALREHMRVHVGRGRDALLFPDTDGGQQVNGGRLSRAFRDARLVAGRPDLRFHDLRHTGATMAAQAGATVSDLMRRLGHATAGAAMVYQHSSEDRDAVIAKALSERAAASNVVPLRRRRAVQA